MNEYYKNLVDQAEQKMRDMVTLVAHEGHTITTVDGHGHKTVRHSKESALEVATRENAERDLTRQYLEHSVRVNPDTGHAYDLDFLAKFCKDIYTVPQSADPLEVAIYSIGETVNSAKYPKEDLRCLIKIFTDLRVHNYYLSVYLCNKINAILERAQRHIA